MLSWSKRIQVGRIFTDVASAEELIPCPHDPVFIGLNYFQQLTKSAGVVTIIVGHFNFRYHPEFCFQVVFPDVNVYWFSWRSFVGVEEKREASIAEDYWRDVTLLYFQYRTTSMIRRPDCPFRIPIME